MALGTIGELDKTVFSRKEDPKMIHTRRIFFHHAQFQDNSASSKQVECPNMRRRRSLRKIDDTLPIRYQASATNRQMNRTFSQYPDMLTANVSFR